MLNGRNCEYLRTTWTARQRQGLVPAESSCSQVKEHVGLQLYNEAIHMGATRLNMSVKELVQGWEQYQSQQAGRKRSKGDSSLWKQGVLKLRKQSGPQDL